MNHHNHSHHYHDHSGKSEVKTTVTYKDGKISIALEDNTGKVPELALAHEKEMHFIMVSNNLEQYYHLHSKKSRKTFIPFNNL